MGCRLDRHRVQDVVSQDSDLTESRQVAMTEEEVGLEERQEADETLLIDLLTAVLLGAWCALCFFT